ncbi:MAG: hypothetical protein QM763_20445 [Agriterribacter sp.]
MNSNQSRLAVISFLTILLSDILDYIAGGGILPFNPAIFTAILRFVSVYCLIVYIRNTNWKDQIPKHAVNLLSFLIVWNVLTIVRGVFNADMYYDWRFLILSSLFYFLIPLSAIIGITILFNGRLLRIIIKKVYFYALLLLPLQALQLMAYARAVISVWFFMMLSIYFKNKWRILIFITAFVSMITAFEIRANFLRVSISVLLFALYTLKGVIKHTWLKITCFTLFLVPFVLIYLGISGTFNIFQPFGEKDEVFVIDNDIGGNENSNLIADTRTGLYVEVLNSVVADNILIFGGGATAKYKSATFELSDNMTERYGAEVGFLNTLLYSGLIGVILYFWVLTYAAYLGLNKSNNFFCKIISIFLGFRWVLFFIEDITKYDMNFYFLWVAVGVCFSNQFRNLSDEQIKIWIAKYVLV